MIGDPGVEGFPRSADRHFVLSGDLGIGWNRLAWTPGFTSDLRREFVRQPSVDGTSVANTPHGKTLCCSGLDSVKRRYYTPST